jgi:hypothetical protein
LCTESSQLYLNIEIRQSLGTARIYIFFSLGVIWAKYVICGNHSKGQQLAAFGPSHMPQPQQRTTAAIAAALIACVSQKSRPHRSLLWQQHSLWNRTNRPSFFSSFPFVCWDRRRRFSNPLQPLLLPTASSPFTKASSNASSAPTAWLPSVEAFGSAPLKGERGRRRRRRKESRKGTRRPICLSEVSYHMQSQSRARSETRIYHRACGGGDVSLLLLHQQL